MTTTTPAADPGPAGTLSPSRAADFLTCPLLYRFRVVDRLPQRPSPAAVRGTLVHAVLERLFDLPADRRTAEDAVALVPQAWAALREADPDLAHAVAADPGGAGRWTDGADALVRRWFALEDPTRLEPAGRELRVETALDDGPVLRGVVDRLDEAPDGRLRVVDYKTGRAPAPTAERRALFQLRFYALVLWRERGVVPSVLQLVYLGSGEVIRYEPDEADLRAVERTIRALWDAIEEASRTGDWQPSPGRGCRWCDFRDLCPAQRPAVASADG